MGQSCCHPKQQQDFIDSNQGQKKQIPSSQMTGPVTDMNKQSNNKQQAFDLSFISSENPQIPSEFQERYKQMTDEMNKEIQDDWKEEEITQTFQFWKKDLHSWKAFKCNFTVQGKEPVQVGEWIIDVHKQKQWKENLKSQEAVEQFNPQVKVINESLKGLGPVSERQFVYLSVFSKLSNGFQLFETSVSHLKVPEKSDPVRGEVFWRMIRVQLDGRDTAIVFQGCVHPKGSIFSVMSGKMVDKIKSQIHALQDCMIKAESLVPNTQKEEEIKKQQGISGVPQEYQERIQVMKAECEQEVDEIKEDFKFWKKDLNQWKAFKCQFVVQNKKVEEVFSWFTDVDKQLKWRDTLKTQQVLQQYNPQIKAVLELLKGIGPVSEREFVFLFLEAPIPNGKSIFESSIEHNAKPIGNDPVRGEMFWRLLNLTQQDSNILVNYAGCVHPRGSIFSFMSGKFTDKVKGQITTLRDLLSK